MHEDPNSSLEDRLRYVQVYLINQFRILQIPREIDILVSWKVNENEKNSKNVVVACIKDLEIWEPAKDLYKHPTNDCSLIDIHRGLVTIYF